MNPMICLCCGEVIQELANEPPFNQNLCACCVNLLEGVDVSELTRTPDEEQPDKSPGLDRNRNITEDYDPADCLHRRRIPPNKPAA
jgi:hypothetical protein